jgi:uncharacterized protein (TIGR02266 family)
MAETKTRARRRRLDSGIRIQDYLTVSQSPEEILFKINEMIYSQAGSDTRKNLRVPISIPVRYQVGGESFEGDTYTLSRDGVFIKTPEPPEENALVRLRMNLPGEDREIEAEGQVIKSTAFEDALSGGAVSGMAVVFSKIREVDRRKILRFVKARAKEMFRPE